MEKSQTLFNYLYDALVRQIVSGKLSYGEKLPSLRSLCQIYQVGIRTVRDVTEKLIREGYIESVQRSHIKVCYLIQGDAAQQAEAVLSRRNSVCSLLKILSCIMPHIYSEAASLCDSQLLQSCREDIAGLKALSPKEQWRAFRTPLQRILSVYHNTLLQDLFIDLDLFLQVNIVPGFDNPYLAFTFNAERDISKLFDRIEAQDCHAVDRMVHNMYRSAAYDVNLYFQALQERYPELEPMQETYQWNAEKGRVRTYMQVTRSLLKKINIGIYADGSYLPTNSELCSEYNISSYTVGKVMDEMERIMVVKQINLRGGYMITGRNAKSKAICDHKGAPSADALAYLNALHLMALLSKGLALLGYDYFNDSMLADLALKARTMKSLNLAPGILHKMVQIQPYEPLKLIYAQLLKLLDWGHYFAFSFDDKPHVSLIRKNNLMMINHIRNHDKFAFAESVRQNYYYIFYMMQGNLSDLGVSEAMNLKLP